MPAYINDPTKVEYYRFFYITWLETDIGCGDSTTPRTIYFHKNSTATFTDPGVGETKTIIYNEILDMVKNISPDNLHDIRKKIKRIYYIKLMLGDKVDIKKFYDIQETIGLWHDCDVTIENIKNLNLREIDDNDYKTIEILSKKRDVLYDDSIKLLNSIF